MRHKRDYDSPPRGLPSPNTPPVPNGDDGALFVEPYDGALFVDPYDPVVV